MNKKLKLNALAAKALSETELNEVRGGGRSCSCGCQYASAGGSSISANCDANYAGGSGGLKATAEVQCSVINVVIR
jgi:natural product precursor